MPLAARRSLALEAGSIPGRLAASEFDARRFHRPYCIRATAIWRVGASGQECHEADQYPPGSTFKVITGSAALQTGVANTGTTITSNGKLVVKGEGGAQSVLYDWAPLGTLHRGLRQGRR